MNLVPRLINNTDKVVKKVIENRLLGNIIYNSRHNRSLTNLNFETDFSNIYKELEFTIDENILFKLGIEDSIEQNKNVISKDSIRIGKGFTINELNSLIINIDSLQYEHMRFPLNPFSPATKQGYKNEDIKKDLLNYLKTLLIPILKKQ